MTRVLTRATAVTSPLTSLTRLEQQEHLRARLPQMLADLRLGRLWQQQGGAAAVAAEEPALAAQPPTLNSHPLPPRAAERAARWQWRARG
jgi:hypothetical protein